MNISGLKTSQNNYGSIEYELEEILGGTTVYIMYSPANKVLDLPSLHQWLENQPREDLTTLVDTIYHTLTEALKPIFLSVQTQRGGIKVNKPPLYSPTYDPACFGVKG